MNKELFSKLFSKFTRVPEKKINDYLKDNDIQTLAEHPESFNVTEMQIKRVNELIELSKLYNRLENFKEYKIENIKDSKVFLDSMFLNKYDKEKFMVAYLDKSNKLLACEVTSVGTLNSAIVHPRDIFKQAVRHGSDRLILSHNHPSGNPLPSREDVSITKRINETAKIFNMEVMDHIVIGRSNHYSFVENERLDNIYHKTGDTKNKANGKLYKKDMNRMVELTSKFTKIPKSQINKTLEEFSIEDFFKNASLCKLEFEQVKKVFDLANLKRVCNFEEMNKTKITGPLDVKDYFDKEYIHMKNKNYNGVVFLNSKNETIKSSLIAEDIDDKSRYVMEKAVLYDSSSMILYENKINNLEITEDMEGQVCLIEEDANLLGIRLLDKLVSKENQYLSFKEEGYVGEDGVDYNFNKDTNDKFKRLSLNEITKKANAKYVKNIKEESVKENFALER